MAARKQKPGLIARGVTAVKKFFGFGGGKGRTQGARGGKGKGGGGNI